jgi:hypothetical protein
VLPRGRGRVGVRLVVEQRQGEGQEALPDGEDDSVGGDLVRLLEATGRRCRHLPPHVLAAAEQLPEPAVPDPRVSVRAGLLGQPGLGLTRRLPHQPVHDHPADRELDERAVGPPAPLEAEQQRIARPAPQRVAAGRALPAVGPRPGPTRSLSSPVYASCAAPSSGTAAVCVSAPAGARPPLAPPTRPVPGPPGPPTAASLGRTADPAAERSSRQQPCRRQEGEPPAHDSL